MEKEFGFEKEECRSGVKESDLHIPKISLRTREIFPWWYHGLARGWYVAEVTKQA
jgi:hypothetical protein